MPTLLRQRQGPNDQATPPGPKCILSQSQLIFGDAHGFMAVLCEPAEIINIRFT